MRHDRRSLNRAERSHRHGARRSAVPSRSLYNRRLTCEVLEERQLLNGYAASDVLYCSDWNAKLFTVNKINGNVTGIGTMPAVMADIAFGPGGLLYGVSTGTGRALYRIDPTNAVATKVGNFTPSLNSLVFRSDGTLFAAGDANNPNLYKVSTTTGATTFVASLGGYIPAGDIAFGPSGNLYMTTTQNNLVKVNPANGACTRVGTKSIGFNMIYGLAFSKDGTLYGVSNDSERLIRINTTTGEGWALDKFWGQHLPQDETNGVLGADIWRGSVPTLSINNVTMLEGDAGTKTFNFAVTLTGTNALGATVKYATNDGTAIAGSDYVGFGKRTLSWPAGTGGSQTVSVTVNGDTDVEPDETFYVDLSDASNATIIKSRGVGTIRSDDLLPGVRISDVSRLEGNSGTTDFVFQVTMSGSNTLGASVDFATADGTATAGSDYVPVSTTTLTWPAGDTSSRTISVSVNGDTDIELNENFFVDLTAPVDVVIDKSRGVGVILNDDITVSSVLVVEAAAPKNGKLETGEKLKMTWATSTPYPSVVHTLTIDGKPLTPAPQINGPYSGLYYSCAIGAWAAGSHTYTLKATGVNGATSSVTGTFDVVAPAPPVIDRVVVAESAAPKNGQLEPGEKLKITWAASSSSGIASQTLTVNGKVVTPIKGPYSGLYYSCEIGAFSAGNYSYTIKATDNNGGESTLPGQFKVDVAGPSIVGVKVLPSGSSVSINWKIYAPGGVASYGLTIDGADVPVTPPGVPGVGYTGTAGPLADGTHDYVITVTDNANRTRTFSGSFVLPAASAVKRAVFSSATQSGVSSSAKVDWLCDIDEMGHLLGATTRRTTI